jgi:hypothetical protein
LSHGLAPLPSSATPPLYGYGERRVGIHTCGHAHTGAACSVQIHGSHNVISVAKCLMNMLLRMSTPEEVARRRGIRILDMTPRNRSGQLGYTPEVYTGADARGRKLPPGWVTGT